MPSGFEDFVNGVTRMMNGFREPSPTAYTRIGRAPVVFTDNPLEVSGVRASGGFDPNTGRIQALRKGRSQRQL
jgi:hypothetical protein